MTTIDPKNPPPIRELREALGISQHQLAHMSRCSRMSIRAHEIAGTWPGDPPKGGRIADQRSLRLRRRILAALNNAQAQADQAPAGWPF